MLSSPFSRKRMGADPYWGPRMPANHQTYRPNVVFSSPIGTGPLPTTQTPMIPPNPLPQNQFGSRKSYSPHHRFKQPRGSILRRPSQIFSDVFSPSNTGTTPVVPPNPFQHYSQNAGSSTPYNHPDPLPAPCARLNTPFRQPQRTPISDDPRNIQYSSFPPPPALIQSTFGSNIGAQFPGATACLVHTPMNTPGNTPGQAIPELPTDMPSLQQWSFPAGVLAWSPHPAPHPNVPASAFWSDANTLQGMPQTQHHYTPKTLRSSQITQITGGHPLPGQDVTWTPGTWPPTPWDMTPVPIRLSPCIIPNPGNPDLPQIVWDITQNPIRAQRITGAHTIIPLASRMGEQAVVPAVQEIHIATQNPIVQQMWGNISLQTVSAATIWDLLHAIYEYFQTPLTYAEVGYLQSLDPNNYDVLVAAWRARCNVTPSLPGFEAAQGLKRADLLGDQRAFWGMWVSIDDAQNSWYLNLGLVNLQSGT